MDKGGSVGNSVDHGSSVHSVGNHWGMDGMSQRGSVDGVGQSVVGHRSGVEGGGNTVDSMGKRGGVEGRGTPWTAWVRGAAWMP